MRGIWIVVVLFAASSGFAADESQKDPHHKGLFSSVNLGIRYSSILENRGLVFYRDFQVDPILGVLLWDDRVEFLGDSLSYRDFVVGDWLRLRTRLVSISDNPLFPSIRSVRKDDLDRPDTYEWSNRAEIFLPGYNGDYLGELDVGYAKDLLRHHGTYLDTQVKVKMFSTRVPFVDTLIEPNLYSTLGWGDGQHNQYFYGSNVAHGGYNNSSYGVWIAFPEEADRNFPIVQITRFQVLGAFRSGDFAVGRNDGWLFSFIATGGLLE